MCFTRFYKLLAVSKKVWIGRMESFCPRGQKPLRRFVYQACHRCTVYSPWIRKTLSLHHVCQLRKYRGNQLIRVKEYEDNSCAVFTKVAIMFSIIPFLCESFSVIAPVESFGISRTTFSNGSSFSPASFVWKSTCDDPPWIRNLFFLIVRIRLQVEVHHDL